jgi:hypothetical protein
VLEARGDKELSADPAQMVGIECCLKTREDRQMVGLDRELDGATRDPQG